MTLFDCTVGSLGEIAEIGGGENTHRRLIDLGLMQSGFRVRAKTKQSVLVDFGGVSCVIRANVAANIQVHER